MKAISGKMKKISSPKKTNIPENVAFETFAHVVAVDFGGNTLVVEVTPVNINKLSIVDSDK